MAQPGIQRRGEKFIANRERSDEFWRVSFEGIKQPFYYPWDASWVDLCQTADESFNPSNWHYFTFGNTPVASDDVVVDCGAAEGLFTFCVAGIAKKVFAIEPIPKWHNALCKTFENQENVEIKKCGIGYRKETLKMSNEEIRSKVSASGDLEVPFETLDSLFLDGEEKITFIKADIEGFEFQMLLGATELIRKCRPKISITVYHDQNHHLQIADFLQGLQPDYRIHYRGIAQNGNPILLQAY